MPSRPTCAAMGETDRPEAIEAYTLFHLTGDMVGVVDALGADQAVVVGHDWGAPVAWHCALFRPDRFRGVAALSVPFRPRARVRPTTAMPQTERSLFYQLYFQTPGVAEAELERDPRAADPAPALFRLGRRSAPQSDRCAGRRGAGHGPARGRLFDPDGRPADPAALADRGGRRLLRRRIRPDRLSRRSQLVPQHRPQLGADGALRRAQGQGSRALCRRRLSTWSSASPGSRS